MNFALTSVHAQAVTLCLFQADRTLVQEISLDPISNKTGDVWHILVRELPSDYLYAFRINHKETFLLDPYGKLVVSRQEWGKFNEPYKPLCAQITETFDWEEDHPPSIPLDNLVLYEMHVRGFTQHPSSKTTHPGTFLAIIEKIPHLLELGINAVELLPVHEFNECETTHINPLTHQRLCNYWGYSTINFFSPMQRYASRCAISEFKTMVKELHRHGIEVILDVVFNHTGEGNEKGPTYCFKGIDKEIYYMLDAKKRYLNFSGCGNTFNCNHPIVRELIRESLRYWVEEMHVDGFRFDLGSILTRGTHGEPLALPPLIDAISHDPLLANRKLIAEPWDAAGMYHVGSFFSYGEDSWSEWNGRYRDRVRKFIKGDGHSGLFITDLCGSQDMYYSTSPCTSVNFVVAHDGFSLADLVAYNHKHNIANGEHNRDGLNENESWNCGVEGPTSKQEVNELRQRQIRNFHVALMVSRGIPMLSMGDEYGHTRKGNNNPWCQDNELNWFLWEKLTEQAEFYRFYRKLIHFRKIHPLLTRNRFLVAEDIESHGREPLKPDWGSTFIAFTLKDLETQNDLYIAFNVGKDLADVRFPDPPEGKRWHWIVNTGNRPPEDFMETPQPITELHYEVMPYSSLILKALLS